MSSITQTMIECQPHRRFEVINLTQHIAQTYGDILQRHAHWFYASLHTTAGFAPPGLCARLQHQRDHLWRFLRLFQHLFPAGNGYYHDRLELRTDLSEAQRQREPKNGDSHLIFMSAGLSNCTVVAQPSPAPVFLLELDGVYNTVSRTRRIAVVGYDSATVLALSRCHVPMASACPWAVDLAHADHGLFAYVEEQIRKTGVETGRVDIALAPQESHAGLTVNEYEPLLMQRDVASVLSKPLRFLPTAGSRSLEGLLQAMRDLGDGLGLHPRCAEILVTTLLQEPTSRFFRLKRKIRVLVSQGRIIQGTYQRPILVQWSRRQPETRAFDVRISRFA